jgi:hypothetical protein
VQPRELARFERFRELGVPSADDFDPIRLLRSLHDAGVEFIVIGGFAGAILGSPAVTYDLDICYARGRDNLEALTGVLRALNARPRGVDRDVPFRLDGKTLAAGDSFTFTTDAGDFDILGTPTGTNGYDELARTAQRVDVDGIPVFVASIDDQIRMKRAAGRSKDLYQVEILSALREELDAGR